MNEKTMPTASDTAFGIRLDGFLLSVEFTSLEQAEAAAPPKRNVEIIDRATGRVIKRLPTG
jgi:hypothetical protein